jgi:hypothetical protein
MALTNANTNTASYNRRGRTEDICSKAIESARGRRPTSNSVEVDIAGNKR